MPACPKPRPHLLSKREAAAKLRALDAAERQKCRQRSGGRCEVLELYTIKVPFEFSDRFPRSETDGLRRCKRAACQNHHLMGGNGRRNKGPSILAEHRIDVCTKCHTDLNNHVLKPAGTLPIFAQFVVYERVR